MSTDPLVLDVERLTFGVDALAHHERQVVFVPYAAPGDRVQVEIVERHAGYLRAGVVTVQRPGPARTLPGCHYFPTCGGCQWQHIAPSAQRDAKGAVVAEQLARIAGVRDAAVLPTLASPGDWGYRSRIALAVEGRRVGYRRARSHALLEIEDCPIAETAVSLHVASARALAATVRVPLRRLTIVAAADGVVLVARTAGRPGPADLEAAEALLARRAAVRGAVLAGAGGRLVAGDPTVTLSPEPGLRLEVPADVFTQVNAGGNRLLVDTVLGAGAFREGQRVLDLYCGAGNFALPIARRGAHVLGVERSAMAVTAARSNAARLELTRATFRRAPVVVGLRDVAPGSIETVVLDPPRSGAADAMAALTAVRAPRIVYVSCDPATLARDVKMLVAAGYRVARVQPLDLFPQTYHIESVAELHLT